MKKILAFFGIGVVILLLDLIFNYDEDELNIFISDQEIESLIYTWELQVGRSPTKEDIKNIIDVYKSQYPIVHFSKKMSLFDFSIKYKQKIIETNVSLSKILKRLDKKFEFFQKNKQG